MWRKNVFNLAIKCKISMKVITQNQPQLECGIPNQTANYFYYFTVKLINRIVYNGNVENHILSFVFSVIKAEHEHQTR